MKTVQNLFTLICLALFLNSCSDDDSPTTQSPAIFLENQTIEVIEHPASSIVLTLNPINSIAPAYTIESQSPNNAVTIDSDGNVIIQDQMAFDFERNDQVIVSVRVTDGDSEDTAQITINITDIPGPEGGLLAYYPFEDTPNDLSSNNNDGTIVGNVATASNRFNKPNSSYAFSGGRIEVPAFETGLATYSISAWIRIENQPSNISFKTIMAKQSLDASDRDFIFRVSDLDKLMFNQNSDSGSETIMEDEWFHVLVIVDNGFSTLFVNGTVIDTFTDAAVWSNANNNIVIGGASVGNELETLHGRIDDILIYNRVLTEQEFQGLVNNNY